MLRDWRMQRALTHRLKPEASFQAREALPQAGRQDLMGGGATA